MGKKTVADEARAALAEAARWRILGLFFERPREGWREELKSLVGESGDEALRALSREILESDEGSYLRLLGPGGAVSPREVAWRPREDPGQVLADLRGFYDAFAFTPRTEDPPDHIAVAAGFMAFMKMKEAYCRSTGDEEAMLIVSKGLRSFRENHLDAFAAALAERLADAGCSPLARAASLMVER